jgi:hypothetical protein
MKFLQFVVAVLAVLCAASVASGVIHRVGWSVVAPLVASILLFVWFVLLRRRSLAAWYLGCVFFTIMLVQVVVFQALLPFLAQPSTLFGWWMLISQTLFGIIIFLFLTKWWIPRKHEFTPTV